MNSQKLFKSLIFSFFLVSIFSISACKKDETPDRDKFLGTYNVIENCDSGNDSYTIVITTSSSSESSVSINNLYDIGDNITATVSGSNINFGSYVAGILYSGSGSISNNVLIINFTLSEIGYEDENCSATATKS